MQTLLSIIGLGFLGIDPTEAILVASAIAARAKKHKIIIFALCFVLGTATLGVILSLLGQGAIDYVQSLIPDDFSPLWAVLNIALIAVIIIWLTVRFTKRDKPKNEKKPKSLFGSSWQFALIGLAFAATAFTDPTFYAVTVLAAETHNAFVMIGLHLLWITISEMPFVAVTVAYLFNAHKPLIKFTDRIWRAHKQKVMIGLYIIAIIVALVLLADTIIFFIRGSYLF